MNKLELIDKIKSILKQEFGNVNLPQNTKEVSLDIPEQFSVLGKFPQLKKIIVDLFTNQFDSFIKEIQWVAPRPTMFKIILNNNQYFYLSYNTRSWVAQIEGKKYYLSNLKEEENACGAISRILKHGNQDLPEEKIETKETEVETGTEKDLESEQ